MRTERMAHILIGLAVGTLLTGSVAAEEGKVGEGWRLHVINAESRFEAAGVLDVNRDGKLDIVCGGFWYEAPTWKKHFLRDIKEEDRKSVV